MNVFYEFHKIVSTYRLKVLTMPCSAALLWRSTPSRASRRMSIS